MDAIILNADFLRPLAHQSNFIRRPKGTSLCGYVENPTTKHWVLKLERTVSWSGSTLPCLRSSAGDTFFTSPYETRKWLVYVLYPSSARGTKINSHGPYCPYTIYRPTPTFTLSLEVQSTIHIWSTFFDCQVSNHTTSDRIFANHSFAQYLLWWCCCSW